MPEEKERVKTRPKKAGDDGPIEDDAQTTGTGDGKIDDIKKKAEEAKKDAEKYRKRSRERMSRVEKDDAQYKQRPGE